MHKTIAHGCSFTRYKWPCWPAYVPWFNGGITMINKGRSASGNETISRGVINSAMKHKEIAHVYIMWSASDRYEVITHEKGEDDRSEMTYRVWDDDFNWSVYYGGHRDKDKNDFFRRHFWNEEHQYYRTLEHILRTQMFLDKKQIPYTMMLFRKNVLRHDCKSESEQAIYNSIDWTKFKFYNDNGGLWEFAEEHFAQYYLKGESHPPPIAHYYWVKDIMFQSDIECPTEELDKLKNYYG